MIQSTVPTKQADAQGRRPMSAQTVAKKKESHRLWLLANKERVREAARRWRLANPAKVREHVLRYRSSHQEQVRAAIRRRYYANRARLCEETRLWRLANPDRHRENGRTWNRRRRARKRGVPSDKYTGAEVFARDKGRCHICMRKIRQGQAWHVDHVIPLVNGGWDVKANVAPAHAACNLRKGAKRVALF